MDKKSAASGDRKLTCEDVSKCFQLLESILDGENIPSSKEVIDQKLAKCAPCFQHYHLEQAIREVLKTKCTKQSTPAELVANIREKIQELK